LRALSAARIEIAAYMPVQRSTIATPTFIGSPPASPVIAISPHSACSRKS
jgi:hypothetical protein